MARIDDLLAGALKAMPLKPPEDASQPEKKSYSEKLSAALALAFGAYLRERGLKEARPAAPGVLKDSGAERRMSGGIGAKKVDVTWATSESGLLLAISIKTINARDKRTKNFQKNLINRRGDMLMEAVTLHRRFPYAVLCGFMFLDRAAASDGTERRQSTFENAHVRLRLFTGRDDPSGRDEQFERLFLVLFDADNTEKPFEFFAVGEHAASQSAEAIMDDILQITATRNPDLYRYKNGRLRSQR